MPITKRQFELSIDPEVEDWMRQIYQFLADHKELAYSLDELGETFGGKKVGDIIIMDSRKRERFGRALEVLLGIGAVEARDIAGTSYYGFHHEVDTDTWELKIQV